MEQPNLNADEMKQTFPSDDSIAEQDQAQTGKRQLRVHIDERHLQTSYVNGFRSTTSPEEVVLDFGLNLIQQTGSRENPKDIVFHAESRIVMNWYCTKRLALGLTKSVQRFEQEFGEIELNTTNRRINKHHQM